MGSRPHQYVIVKQVYVCTGEDHNKHLWYILKVETMICKRLSDTVNTKERKKMSLGFHTKTNI